MFEKKFIESEIFEVARNRLEFSQSILACHMKAFSIRDANGSVMEPFANPLPPIFLGLFIMLVMEVSVTELKDISSVTAQEYTMRKTFRAFYQL